VVRRPPEGTEDVYKIYAESLRGDDHLDPRSPWSVVVPWER
jgi:phosphoglucomutase